MFTPSLYLSLSFSMASREGECEVGFEDQRNTPRCKYIVLPSCHLPSASAGNTYVREQGL